MKGESFHLQGEAGHIECLVEFPDRPNHAWVVLHPHPLFGGTMQIPILYHLRNAIHQNGGATLSFNFRGVGLTSGTFTGGSGELKDAEVVYEHTLKRFPGFQISLLGYSFGAVIGLELAHLKLLDTLVMVGFPLSYHVGFSGKLLANRAFILQGEKDEFGTPAEVKNSFEESGVDLEVVKVPASNHFFENHMFDLMNAFDESVYGVTGTE